MESDIELSGIGYPSFLRCWHSLITQSSHFTDEHNDDFQNLYNLQTKMGWNKLLLQIVAGHWLLIYSYLNCLQLMLSSIFSDFFELYWSRAP